MTWLHWQSDGQLNNSPKLPRNSKLILLNLRNSSIETLCESIGNAGNLEVLNLSSTLSLGRLPNSLGGLKNLQDLKLGGSGIRSLPESFGELSNLEVLDMNSC